MQDQLILNRYRPISEAGSGGFATVQLAWDTRIQRRVAIKCIQLNKEQVEQGILPGLEEARTAAMLTDGNIVGVFDFEVQGSTAYLIMEYVDGLTLTELLAEYGSELSLDAIAAIFSSIAHALEIAHENQVLHLDIKPDNILINRQGQVKVSDFGLATLSDAGGFGSASGGTIGYMPPEQMRQENLDARCDEWALASLSYEMITGENPFFAHDLKLAEATIYDAEIVLPSLCRDDLPHGADDVLFYALDPDREERYDKVTDFAEELERFLGNPVKGQRELAVFVGQANEDFEDEGDFIERIPFIDRISERSFAVLGRMWSVLSIALLSFVSLSNIPQTEGLTNPLFWGIAALLVIAAVLKPHLGAILGLFVLIVSLFFNEAYLVGVILFAATAAWWFFVGRKGDNQTNTALAPVLFGAFGFNQITPLLVGFFLDIRETVINCVMALLLSVILAGFGSASLLGWNAISFWDISSVDVQHNIALMLQQPSTWFIVLSWVLAAIIVRVFCLRQTRLFAFFGIALGTAVLLFGLLLGMGFSDWVPFVVTLTAGVIMSAVCALGVPTRS